MDAILEELGSLSDSDLCQELKSAGLPFGGISKSTRKFFVKRLATHKLKEQGSGNGDPQTRSENGEGQEKPCALGDSKKEGHAKTGPTTEEKKTGNPVTNGDTSSSKGAVGDKVVAGNQSTSFVKGEIIYVVCIPIQDGNVQNGESSVGSVTTKFSQNKKEVLKLLKENTEARFKQFKTLDEAQTFARSQANLTTPKKANIVSNSSEQPASSDRPNSYRTPKPQQLNALRFAIEKKDKEKFRSLIWGNPRLLVTSVDTPTTLHEGCKYNALHVAAMKNLPGMMELILETIGDPEIPRMLYPGESEDARTDRWGFLTHLYLNSLEKGNGETPLHFASKFGFVDCVSLLLGHPKCNKQMANKYGQTASEIICNRYRNNDKEKVKAAIAELLDDHFYVPMWRTEDNSSPAVIGEPWSPDVPNSQSALLSEQPKGSPIDSNISLRALAGPMSPSEAVDFRKEWKTPPSSSKKKAVAVRRGDSEKGLERLGRELAHTRRVPWMEYWTFLDDFVDFSKTEGLEILEGYLANRYCELKETSSVKKSSITKDPSAVMKNLVTEFVSSTSNQAGSSTSTPNKDGMDAVKSKTGEERISNMELKKCEPDNQFTCDQTNKSTDSARESNVQSIACELEEMSLSSKEKSDRNFGEKRADDSEGALRNSLRLNAGGDSCTVSFVQSPKEPSSDTVLGATEQPPETKPSTPDALGRISSAGEFKETLDRTSHPVVSPNCKPIKNSTESRASGELTEHTSPASTACQSPCPEPIGSSNLRTPERTSMAGQMTKLLFSPVQMITNMMSQLSLGSVKRQIVSEESDVDTGVSDETENLVDHERKGGMSVSNNAACDSQNILETPLNHEQNQIASIGPRFYDGANENTKKSDTSHPVASVEHSSTPRTTTSLEGSAMATHQPELSESDHVLHHEENASPDRTGDATANGVSCFKTPENQKILSSSPSPTSGSPECRILFINGDLPTKIDQHVLRAIENIDIDDRFPFVKRWRQAVEQVPEETRQRWRTPAHSHYGSPFRSGTPPSHHRHHAHSPLIGGRSPVLQRLHCWSEPISRGAGSRTNQAGDHRGTFGRGQSPTSAGLDKTPKQNLMVSAYMQ
nr:ankyrin repeat and LEM domain-containing protein 2-like isoform X1 [Lytechinus pictus]